jgi:hypothetical protein
MLNIQNMKTGERGLKRENLILLGYETMYTRLRDGRRGLRKKFTENCFFFSNCALNVTAGKEL